MDKRTFLKGITLAGLPFALPGMVQAGTAVPARSSASGEQAALDEPPPLAERLARFAGRSANSLATDDEFWSSVRSGYKLKPEYINLENGYYNILPEEILTAFIRHVQEVNLEGAHYMRTVQFDNKKAVAARLAALGGCSPEELIITRNTTESLDMIIAGYPWKAGDEAIMAYQDYGAMLQMFRQVEKRHGVVPRVISVPGNPSSDDEVVAVYEGAITSRTRLLMVSHMINITGQVLPVRKICDMAHARGVEVMVDGAHTFAQIPHSIPALGCDYYGASLHKWLSTPLGAGILYVRTAQASKIWPLLAEPDTTTTGIARLNHTGTIPVHTDLAIGDAIDYYTTLGPERKEARLRYLQQYWTTKVRGTPNIVVNTPIDPLRSCAIANIGIKGIKPADLAARLLSEYKIYTVAIDSPEAHVQGCRITPNVFTLPEELDSLVAALQAMAKTL